MVQSEKRLLWHPRHDNKFIVGGGSQITLYQWAPEQPEIRQVTSQHDLQHLKCFAWSSDPLLDDLIAVGNTTGKIDILRLESSKFSQGSNVLPSGQGVSLHVRNSRSCNAVAFNPENPNYLASGFDKVRGDPSLIIWDIHSAAAALSLSLPTTTSLSSAPPSGSPHTSFLPQGGTTRTTDSRVLQQHASTETVSALSFLQHTPHLLLASISHRWLRLFDLRTPVPATTNVASKVQGITTCPFDPHRFACFGEDTVALWDARKMGGGPLLMFSERDATADGAVVRPGTGHAGIEFSETRRGLLASLGKEAVYVRFWDIMGPQEMEDGLAVPKDMMRVASAQGKKSWAATIPWPSGAGGSGVGNQSSSQEEQPFLSMPILTDTRRTKSFARLLSSFVLVPPSSTGSSWKPPLTSNVMVVNREGDLELYAVHDTPKQAVWSARGDLTISAGVDCRVINGYEPLTGEDHDRSLARSGNDSIVSRERHRSSKTGPVIPPPPLLFGRGDEDGFPALGSAGLATAVPLGRKGRAEERARLDELGLDLIGMTSRGQSRVRRGRGGLEQVVESDISMVMRRRAARGYGLSEPERNISIVRECDPFGGATQMLVDLWAWIYHSHEYLTIPTSIINGYDFKHQGLLGIWEGFPPIEAPSSSSPSSAQSPQPPNHKPTQEYFESPGPIPLVSVPAFHLQERRSGRLSHAHTPLPGSSHTHTPVGHSHTHTHTHTPIGHSHTHTPIGHTHTPVDEAQGQFHAALEVLVGRGNNVLGNVGRPWKPPVQSGKVLQRQIALQLCGWSLREEEVVAVLQRWEREGKISRAACWMVFLKQYNKAISLLMRSSDESHRMMSGTIAALVPYSSSSSSSNPTSRPPELREHCERLIVGLEDPYFRALLTHLALNDWSEVLEEESLPFRERLAIAFQFLDDKAVGAYLRRCVERGGDVDAVVVAGVGSRRGVELVQGYVDRTGDVQSGALVGSLVCPPGTRGGGGGVRKKGNEGKGGMVGVERMVERWVESYRDLLDGFKMFHCRVGFDIERGQVALALAGGTGAGVGVAAEGGVGDWVPRQILIRCNYCNKPVCPDPGLGTEAGGQRVERPTTCRHCNRALPRCSVCLITLSIVQDAARDAELLHSHASKDTIDDAIVMCQTCRHGGHVAHILDWFYGESGGPAHDVCPVADCDCRCAEEI